ncbi:hypothetical protein ACINWC323_2703 [Acinetobacter sp. WC-323]|nr:hypothetical protein ACINWC323_2703 [Acinetobacter sp. WC-323]
MFLYVQNKNSLLGSNKLFTGRNGKSGFGFKHTALGSS